jgi:hypothetical protein
MTCSDANACGWPVNRRNIRGLRLAVTLTLQTIQREPFRGLSAEDRFCTASFSSADLSRRRRSSPRRAVLSDRLITVSSCRNGRSHAVRRIWISAVRWGYGLSGAPIDYSVLTEPYEEERRGRWCRPLWRLASVRREIGQNELPGRPARHVVARSVRGVCLAAHRPGSHFTRLKGRLWRVTRRARRRAIRCAQVTG